jgi:DNA-binding Xre family transcriptional regulator
MFVNRNIETFWKEFDHPKQTGRENMADTFNKRLKQLVRHMTDTELGATIGTSADAARKLRQGSIKSLKLHAALRLARKLDISPWQLAGEMEQGTPLSASTSTGRGRKQGAAATEPADQPQTKHLEDAITALTEKIARFQNETRVNFHELKVAITQQQGEASPTSTRKHRNATSP